jgi:fructose-1,6-bisphosphatase I
MVADVHRTLLYGGVFGYPADSKNKNGKLRLLYEGAPMSFIMEQAGGISTTGTQRVMEISPHVVHQRVPIVMGSKVNVQEVIDAYATFGTGNI